MGDVWTHDLRDVADQGGVGHGLIQSHVTAIPCFSRVNGFSQLPFRPPGSLVAPASAMECVSRVASLETYF